MPYCRKYWVITCMLLVSYFGMKAGDTLTSVNVESESYRLYMQKDWQSLSHFCDKVIHAGYDYYYLRMRAGIASYELKRYRKAVGHFRKALGFNCNDETANRYLYFSYLYAGQYEEARKFTRSIDTLTQKDIGTYKLNPVAFTSLEAAVKLSDSSSKFKPVNYVQFGIQHYIGRKFSLYHALTYYAQNEYRDNVKQFQYYLAATVPLKKGFVLSVGAHTLYDNLSIREISTTTVYPQGQPQPAQPVIKTFTTYVGQQSMALVTAATLTKRMTYMDVSLGTTVSFYDTASQYQLQAGISCFPFANRKLAFGGIVYHHSEDSYSSAHVAFAPFISSLLTPKLFVSAAFLLNKGGNISEGNGYFVNNSLDLSRSRTSLTAEYRAFKNINVYATYAYEDKQEKYTRYTYHYNAFLIGIKLIP